MTEPSPDDVPCCEVELPGGTIKLHGTITPALLRILVVELTDDSAADRYLNLDYRWRHRYALKER